MNLSRMLATGVCLGLALTIPSQAATNLPTASKEAACREAAGFDARGYVVREVEQPKKAISLCRQALAKHPNDAQLMAYLGRALYTDKQYKESHQVIAQSASLGNSLGQSLMGVLYEFGYDVGKDLKQAAAWYQKGALAGNTLGQYNLANCYLNGRGVSPNAPLAIEWFKKAASQDDAEAMYTLGNLYREGRGVPKDRAKAIEWNDKAAKLEHGGAMARRLMNAIEDFATNDATPAQKNKRFVVPGQPAS